MHLIYSYFSHYIQLSIIVFISIIIDNKFGPKTKKSKEQLEKEINEDIRTISSFSLPVGNLCVYIKALSNKNSKIFETCFYVIISLIPI